jgi:hypothetical protein
VCFLDHQIAVGIKAGRAAPEGLGPVGIRKNVVAVTVALGHGQLRVQRHPVNKVGQLAKSAPAAVNDLSVLQDHTVEVTFL